MVVKECENNRAECREIHTTLGMLTMRRGENEPERKMHLEAPNGVQ